MEFARGENATQLVMGASRRTRLQELTRGSVINKVLRNSGPIDVHVISTDAEGPAGLGFGAADAAGSPPSPPGAGPPAG